MLASGNLQARNSPKPIVPRTVRELRTGWVTLQVPPLEAWESRLCWLLPEQRERVETPEFFQLVQQHVTRRYLALKPKGA